MKFSWTKLQPAVVGGVIPRQRSSHGVSLLGKDTLLVYGGENVARTPIEDEADSVWVWRNMTWTKVACKGTPPPSRIAHAQAVYKDRYVYVFGGRAGITMKEQAMNDLWVLDTENDYTWTQVMTTKEGDAPEPRSFHRMICVDSSLYVFGGCGAVSGRLADLHKFDIEARTWSNLGTTSLLKGRGGPNVLPLANGSKIAVVAGFAGEETNDGHCYDLKSGAWESEPLNKLLEGLRPRSVCSAGSFPSVGVSVVFGGEVDPSDRGHEGAGGFENDVVVLDSQTGAYKTTMKAPENEEWPQQRGWADADGYDDGNGRGSFFLFGGLSGDDEKPERLNDLWKLEIEG